VRAVQFAGEKQMKFGIFYERQIPRPWDPNVEHRIYREALPEFDEREEARAKQKQEELAPFIEQAMMRKQKVAPLAEDKIPSFVALGRQVAANGPQLTPEQEAARRRMLAAAQIPLENPEKASAAE
jgi:hypothetical protein